MLAPDARAVLLDLLRPPPGYELDMGIATTFTLDLSAALTAPLAFAARAMHDTADPIAVMESIRAVTDRIDIFCQAGHISVPRQASDLAAFLEPMIHEVHAHRPGHLFHPKLWLLRFESYDDWTYRLVVPTRNLTSETSWDAVLALDGREGTRPLASNRPLVDLLKALPNMTTDPLVDERRERITELAEELRYIVWQRPNDVREIAFHVFGVKGTPSIDLDGYRHLIISPYLTDDGVRQITEAARGDVTVVSRSEELEKLDPATLDGLDTWVLCPLAGLEVLDESDDSDEGESLADILGGLHAKAYVLERHGGARFFVGSLNCTGAGFGGNVEILVELSGKQKTMGVDAFLADDAPFVSLLEPYSADGGQVESSQEEAHRRLDAWLRGAAERRFELQMRPVDGAWDLALTIDGTIQPPIDGRAVVEVLGREGDALAFPLDETEPVFGPMPLADVSAFLVVHGWMPYEGGEVYGSTVVRSALIDEPEDRLDEILARQVDTPEKFLRFLLLLLSLAGDDAAAETLKGAEAGNESGSWVSTSGVLELVVRALADQSEAIEDLDRLVERLRATESGRAVLPEGFDELWAEVTTARQALSGVAE